MSSIADFFAPKASLFRCRQKANNLALELGDSDPDWSYNVISVDGGYHIEITDEEDEIVGYFETFEDWKKRTKYSK